MEKGLLEKKRYREVWEYIEYSESLVKWPTMSEQIRGGFLYGLLTYAIVITLNLPLQAAIGFGFIVLFLYLGSRPLILFSGINTPYYSREWRGSPYENTAFNQTSNG